MLDGSLSDEELRPLADHIEACHNCQDTLDDLSNVNVTWSQKKTSPEAQDDVLESVVRRIKALTNTGISAETDSLDEIVPCWLDPSDTPGFLGRIDRYDVEKVLGRGGMGVVLQAVDRTLNRLVAIKVLAPHLAASGVARKRFLREAQAIAAVTHEQVIKIYAVEERNGLPYIVMELISGTSLEERIKNTGPLDCDSIVKIGKQIADGLAAAHKQGLIHRDIKPGNILLDEETSRVKITDFGLARGVDDAGLTQSGMVTGTPQFMSPEQAAEEETDQRSDVFSLGSVLYMMCTGRPPFAGSSSLAIMRQVAEGTAKPIHEFNPDVPLWLVELIQKTHEKSADQRIQSAEEVACLLEQHQSPRNQPTVVPAPRFWHQRTLRSTLHWLLLLIAVVAVGFMASPMPSWRRNQTDQSDANTSLDSPARKESADDDDDEKPTAKPVATLPMCPFVTLAEGELIEESYASLPEAIAAAPNKATIEVRGNGPFAIPPISIGRRSIAIRAASGYSPILEVLDDPDQAATPALTASGPLTLEGLTFRFAPSPSLGESRNLIKVISAPVRAANCRFQTGAGALWELSRLGSGVPYVELQNCMVSGTGGVSLNADGTPTSIISNNILFSGAIPLSISSSGEAMRLPNKQWIFKNTIIGRYPLALAHSMGQDDVERHPDLPELSWHDNLLWGSSGIVRAQASGSQTPGDAIHTDGDQSLRRSFRWSGTRNLVCSATIVFPFSDN
ncbi:MAG: serine/threonine protein kinase [Planctomycetales bacterium]|nr:serine/threonine protein kinase [Planctomycetales bacterium]